MQQHLTILRRSWLDTGATVSVLVPDAMLRGRKLRKGCAWLVIGHVLHLWMRREVTSLGSCERFASECTTGTGVGIPRASTVVELRRPQSRQGHALTPIFRWRQTGGGSAARLTVLVVALEPINCRVNAYRPRVLLRRCTPVACAVPASVYIARGLVLHHCTCLHVASHLETTVSSVAFALPAPKQKKTRQIVQSIIMFEPRLLLSLSSTQSPCQRPQRNENAHVRRGRTMLRCR